MWAHAVVVDAPGIEHGAGLRQRREQRLVEALVPQPADEAVGECDLPTPISAMSVCGTRDPYRETLSVIDERLTRLPDFFETTSDSRAAFPITLGDSGCC